MPCLWHSRQHMIQMHRHQYGDVYFNRKCHNRGIAQDKGGNDEFVKDECEPLVFEKEWLVGMVLLGMTILEGGSGSVRDVRIMEALAGMEKSRLCIQLQISPVASYPNFTSQ